MNVDKRRAEVILRGEAAAAATRPVDAAWEAKVRQLSQLCLDGTARTHVAFLGTEMLAKATEPQADLFAIKPKHAPGNPCAYSARSLCHGVLVPVSAELGFSIGVTGREPLNNQPYFRMTRFGDGTPVHAGGQAAFEYLVELVKELHKGDAAAARQALRAFIAVRRSHQPQYGEAGDIAALLPKGLLSAITSLLAAGSEGGKVAQAVVAGLMDVVAGPERVESGRVNDPSRRNPGDVCVRSANDPDTWEKAIEVRDKPVLFSDVAIFGRTCVSRGAREAAVVMVAEEQTPIDPDQVQRWSDENGVSLTLFAGWAAFVEQALFWSAPPKPVAAGVAAATIHGRLVGVEASPAAVARWQELVRREAASASGDK